MHIKNNILLFIIIIFIEKTLYAGLSVNEVACNTPGDDWVELCFYSDKKESIEISDFYVTMYYGSNERLSNGPVTIYSYDRPETSWDDRFIVVHMTGPGKADETDLTGDTNHNGYIDVYCNNTSPWTTDCVVAIDVDDDPSNGGIIDFIAYSNRDGTPNSTISSYVQNAQKINLWCSWSGSNIQECMIDIGEKELQPYMTIARKYASDSNSSDDFEITKYMTPGRENILSGAGQTVKKLFKMNSKKVSVTPGNFVNGNTEIKLFIFETCNIRLRIFSSIGMLIYESPLYKNSIPGPSSLYWDLRGSGRKAITGLYIALIEATKKEVKITQEERIYLILSQYKK